nr:TIM barrel protein [Enterovibrio nigricans]
MARSHTFQGIELWGAHAMGLEHQPQYDANWLRDMGLSISMLSDYLPIVGDEHDAKQKCQHICRLAKHWETTKVRTFAGHQGSASVCSDERAKMTFRLRCICDFAQQQGLSVLVETHPGTLADTPQSILQLLEEVNHPALKLNFDTLHVWEAGEDPVSFHAEVAEHVGHYHLKNVLSRELLGIFARIMCIRRQEAVLAWCLISWRSGLSQICTGINEIQKRLCLVRVVWP